MTLIEDVRTSFDESREEMSDDKGPVTIIRDGDTELAPGFNGMRAYYENRLLAIARRGYRHFAGGTMPQNSDELMHRTGHLMMPLLTGIQIQAFSDGVLIGHQDNHQVKISHHFGVIDHLYSDEDFRAASNTMAQGFADDNEVLEFFTEFAAGGVEHMTHITGFAHRKVDPGKVWDVWLLIGTACTCSGYLAGHRMGTTWKERDVLSSIEIAFEEGSHGAEGEA